MGKSEVPDLLSTPNGGRKNLPLKKVTKQNTTKTVTRFKNLVVEDSGKTIETSPGGGFTYFFMYTPYIWGEMIPILTSIFFRWVGPFNHQHE